MIKKYFDEIKYIILFIISTFVFVALYHNVIWGDTTNMFNDIGCDSIFMAYPNQYLKDGLVSGGYVLNYGLGAYIPGKWLEMLQPFNLIRLFISDIVVANIIALYLEYIVITLFAYLFFKKMLREDISSMVCAIIWTYSGYAVLWGQHDYTVNIVYLTIIMYFLQGMLEGEKKSYFLVVPFAILAIKSYYYFYMDGIFSAIYIIAYSVANKINIKECGKNILKLFFTGVASIGIGAVGLLPGLSKFLVSARTSVQEQKVNSLFYDTKYMFTAVGRCLSNDIFGTGNNFTGYYNYYEAAVLVCSALLIPCIVIIANSKKYTKQVISLLCIGTIMLTMPIFSYIMNLDSRKPRWTFMIIFAMVMTIGYCIRDIINGKYVVKIKDIVGTIIIYILLFSILMIGDRSGIADVKRAPFVLVVAFTVCYLTILYIMSITRWHKQGGIVILILVIAEMIFNNYPAVNYRDHVTKEMLVNGTYNDGTKDVLEYISDNEDIYRVNKTYYSVFLNDSMVQGYNGLSVYDATNSQYLIDFYQSLGYELMNGKIHCVSIGTDKSILNTLLGVKYIVARSGDAVPDSYKLVYSYGDKELYYNEKNIGFGYIYNNEISKVQYETLTMDDKIKSLCKYYYKTDETDAGNMEDVDIKDLNIDTELDILRMNSAHGTSINANCIKLTIDNHYNSNSVLCVPIIYDSNWKAYINGKQATCININGGLLGIDISGYNKGTYEVKLVYNTKIYLYGEVISIISSLVYICIGFWIFKHKNIEELKF